MENKLKHLEMVQSVISRMASSSFLIKGWSVVLVSALFALSIGKESKPLVCLAYFPALAFWILDAYFLMQESLYRDLYDQVRQMQDSDIDFSMRPRQPEKLAKEWLCTMFSKTLLIYHGMVLLVVVGATVGVNVQCRG